VRLHGSCVRFLERGVLIRGASGAGKSDLVLRLIAAGAWLVADDLVRLWAVGGRLYAGALDPPGLVELRGQGIYRLPTLASTRVDLLLRLGAAGSGSRLPEPRAVAICGVELVEAGIDPGHPSAVARIGALLWAGRVA